MSVQEEKPSIEVPTKTSVRELRNTELVSRLLAATPPYLYGALPLQPHAFFFSEMLRSFVNARHGCRPTYQRRFKRRSHKYYAENEDWRRDWKTEEDKKEERPEVPLELTVDKHARVRESPPKSPKVEHKSSGSPEPPSRQSFVDVGTEELPKPAPCIGRNPTDATVPPSNLILPPPPPMWYPPIYNPQFGVDPLNFFIDLRVSGHIYDRKRAPDNLEPANQELRPEQGIDKRFAREFGHRRHLSAFSVPVRGNSDQSYTKYFDNAQNKSVDGKINGTSYIMKNLKHMYEDMRSSKDVKDGGEKEDTKADSSDVDEDIVG